MSALVCTMGGVRVFVSYRRSDAAGHAGRLRDDLTERLGSGSVFQDVASIAAGERFLDAIERSIGSCDIILAVIGRRWIESDTSTGRRRLDDPHDVVRREIGTALRTGRRVVPVLVDRGLLPEPAMLPEELRPLLERNAIELRDEAWDADLRRLYAAIGVPTQEPGPRRRWAVPTVIGAVLLLVAAVLVSRHLMGDAGHQGSSVPLVSVPTSRPQPLPAVTTVQTRYPDDPAGGHIEWTVQQWWQDQQQGSQDTKVSVELKITNDTGVGISVYRELFRLLADRVAQPLPDLGRLGVEESPDPHQASRHLLVFSRVPAGQPLQLLVGYRDDLRQFILRPTG